MNPTLELRHVELRVPDLAASVDFYAHQLGFAVARQTSGSAELSPSPDAAPILTLAGDASAVLPPRSAAGLFHAALLLPSRSSLGAWLRRAAGRGVEFEGFSDHGVSEAIYLSDPDGNGLEFYVDRPREEWPWAGSQVEMTTRPLDVEALLRADAAPSSVTLAGAHWGHLHLRVTDLDRSEAFYREQLGVAVMQRTFPGAKFLAADNYHHHIGLNTWGHPRQPQPAGAAGLAVATFGKKGETSTREIRDPDAITIRVAP